MTKPPADLTWDKVVLLVTKVVEDGLQATLHGGSYGAFGPERYPLMIRDEGDGVLDRLRRLEDQ